MQDATHLMRTSGYGAHLPPSFEGLKQLDIAFYGVVGSTLQSLM
jgi:hypothetical protein